MKSTVDTYPRMHISLARSAKPDKVSEHRKVRRIRVVSVILAFVAVLLTIVCFFMFTAGIPSANVLFYMVLTCSLLLIIYLVLWNLCHTKKFARAAAAMRELFLIFLAVCIAGFIVLQGLIMSGAQYDGADAEVIIVLGAGIYGEIPSRILSSRLDAAIEYLNTHKGVTVIVSGGQGKGESISEAEAMYRYLIRCGVKESSIIKEEASTSTRENLAFSLALMEEAGLSAEDVKLAVVTNEFHLYRAKRVAGTLGADASGIPAKTPYLSSRVLYQCREAVAVLSDLIRYDILHS